MSEILSALKYPCSTRSGLDWAKPTAKACHEVLPIGIVIIEFREAVNMLTKSLPASLCLRQDRLKGECLAAYSLRVQREEPTPRIPLPLEKGGWEGFEACHESALS